MQSNNQPKLYCFFGHHKCASTYVIDICYEICNVLGLKPIYNKIAFEAHPEQYSTIKKSSLLISQTTTVDKLDKLGSDFKAFHVIRDPRDICVSGYYSHLKTHPIKGWENLEKHRELLQTLDKNEGLLKEFEFSDVYLKHIGDWNYLDPRIFEIKMEDLTESPIESWIAIFKFMGLMDNTNKNNRILYNFNSKINRVLKYKNIPETLRLNKNGLLPESIENLVAHKYSFKKLSKGRINGQENVNSHYRKGLRGDWKNHFTEMHKTVFKEKYGDLLIKLGYESGYNW